MRNIKGIAMATDGRMKRIAITYDEIDASGKVINSNVKINRVVTDPEMVETIDKVSDYAQMIVDAE